MFKHKHRISVILLIALLLVMGMVSSAYALDIRSGNIVNIPESTIKGPLFAAGNDIVIDGNVDGDAFVAGDTITINGNINGDLIIAGSTVQVNGNVKGDIRSAAATVSIKGEVGQSLTAATGELMLYENAVINRDALVFAAMANLAGAVGNQLLSSGENIRINGPVGGNVHIWRVKTLEVGPEANIEGSLNYGSVAEASIAQEATIAGVTNWERIAPPPRHAYFFEFLNWFGLLASFAAGVPLWGIFSLLFPSLWSSISANVQKSPLLALGWGLLLLLVTPLAVLLLLITIVGIPISLILTIVYIILISGAKIIIGDSVGRLLAIRFGWEKRIHSVFPFLIGYAALLLLSKMPVIGFFINVIIICMAIGSVFLTFYLWRRKSMLPALSE
jgi:cytoskeletal protein CcmA (bactofilin family)